MEHKYTVLLTRQGQAPKPARWPVLAGAALALGALVAAWKVWPLLVYGAILAVEALV